MKSFWCVNRYLPISLCVFVKPYLVRHFSCILTCNLTDLYLISIYIHICVMYHIQLSAYTNWIYHEIIDSYFPILIFFILNLSYTYEYYEISYFFCSQNAVSIHCATSFDSKSQDTAQKCIIYFIKEPTYLYSLAWHQKEQTYLV